MNFQDPNMCSYIHLRTNSNKGGATVAFVRESGIIFYAIAFCNPSDIFVKKTGREVASSRLFENLSRKKCEFIDIKTEVKKTLGSMPFFVYRLVEVDNYIDEDVTKAFYCSLSDIVEKETKKFFSNLGHNELEFKKSDIIKYLKNTKSKLSELA